MRKGKRETGKIKLTGSKSGRLIYAILIVVFAGVAIFALYNIFSIQAEYNAAQDEYAQLRKLIPETNENIDETPYNEEDFEEDDDIEQEEIISIDNGFDLSHLNPDYIGWIRIKGTDIDYPVVQGSSNYQYLRTTFLGESNNSGTIFKDYRIKTGFNGFTVLYGHNMRDGTMFEDLHLYRDIAFREKHPDITIFLPDGEILVYRIFEVRVTDVDDPVYNLIGENQSFIYNYFSRNNLQENSPVLVLSTCVRGDELGRLLVLASR